MVLSEHFLHFVWQFRLYKVMNISCVGDEPLRVLHPGVLNKHAGPDFTAAKLLIDGKMWVGNIEIHIKSSDWLLHGHQHNPAYDAVILHVVYTHDKDIYRKDGSMIPVLVLKDLFPDQLLNNYEELMGTINKFPCEKQVREIAPIVVNGFLSRVLVERMEQKSALVFDKLEKLNGDWDGTFYQFLAKSFGFKVNELPFELLATALPQQLLAKHMDNSTQIEALVFGQAGFLSGPLTDEYPIRLKQEYTFLQKKYGLKPIDVATWRFLRMRPQNFPTLRLAQFCGLIIKSKHLFSKVLDIEQLSGLVELLQDIPVNPYWLTHYHFQKETKKVNLQLGLRSVHHVIINTLCVFLFAYGKYTDREELSDRSFDFLEQMPAENNAIVDLYDDAGLTVDNAFFSQALIQLNKNYCDQKKCLNCAIGIKILNK